ncbi:DUF4255 domain-containing protein [Variovorax sp. JS1663]|uniref:DUF4255 domain-containing protein n=1 Tax=Variovorax sp. JS1663 TaxID=1851577 RepID=UPI000B767E82|nr:DUF4255 domain-containing protein [Variovorax sp. JS1663]OUL98521.1 hypothetical protein A8M77_31150 [Variovorax sp. JS1663]
MSNHLAVATVTAALGQRVHASAQQAVGGVNLRFGRPEAPAAGPPQRRVHVYLYQVAANAALRNDDLPSRGADGRLVRRPQAALELHYLLSFYGDDQLLEPDRMLGAVSRDLHARPLLSAQNISDALAGHPELAGSDLADAFERVRFTPTTLTLDEHSKLWSVMVQTPHALSLAYTASVVLLDAVETASPVLPVLRRGPHDQGVEATAASIPLLEEGWVGFPAAAERQPRLPSLRAAPLDSRLIIVGRNLEGDAVSLRFRHPLRPPLDIDVAPGDRDAGQLRLTLGEDPAVPDPWAAGVYSVVASVRRGSATARSPAWPLLVAPTVTSIVPNPATRVGGSVTLTLGCRPRIQPGQAVSLLIADREVPAQPHAAVTGTVDFVIPSAPAGAGQLVWLRVDGVDSVPVRIDPADGAFAFDDAQRVDIA